MQEALSRGVRPHKRQRSSRTLALRAGAPRGARSRREAHLAGSCHILLAPLVCLLLAGCARPVKTPEAPPFNPEGRWRSERGFVLTARLLPDGALELTDARGGKHVFKKSGPERWEAKITKFVEASITRRGDQLVFRRQPTAEGRKPVAEGKGLTLVRNIKTLEDVMTRVPDEAPPAPGDEAPPASRRVGPTTPR